MADTRSTLQGTTFRDSRFGFEPEPAAHGFLVIRSSSTAAERTADTVPSATRRVLAAPEMPASHA
jgi:hypothetical protein